MKTYLDRWALRRLTRHLSPDEDQVLVAGVEFGGGYWAAYRSLDEIGGRPVMVWGIPPKPVTEWSRRRLKRYLRDFGDSE